MREVRDVAVGQTSPRRDLLDQPAQAGAEDDADARLARQRRLNGRCRFLDSDRTVPPWSKSVLVAVRQLRENCDRC